MFITVVLPHRFCAIGLFFGCIVPLTFQLKGVLLAVSLMFKYLTSCNFIFIRLSFVSSWSLHHFHRFSFCFNIKIEGTTAIIVFPVTIALPQKMLWHFSHDVDKSNALIPKILFHQSTIYGCRQDFYYLAVIQFPRVSAI